MQERELGKVVKHRILVFYQVKFAQDQRQEDNDSNKQALYCKIALPVTRVFYFFWHEAYSLFLTPHDKKPAESKGEPY